MSLLSWALCARRIGQEPQEWHREFLSVPGKQQNSFLDLNGLCENNELPRWIKGAHVNGCFHLQINYLWVEPIIILQHFVFSASFRQKCFCGPNDWFFPKEESWFSLHFPGISSPPSWVVPVLDPELKQISQNLNSSWGTKQTDKTILTNISLWLPGLRAAKARRKKVSAGNKVKTIQCWDWSRFICRNTNFSFFKMELGCIKRKSASRESVSQRDNLLVMGMVLNYK